MVEKITDNQSKLILEKFTPIFEEFFNNFRNDFNKVVLDNEDTYEMEVAFEECGIFFKTNVTSIESGATKIVLITNEDYVLKIPFNCGEGCEFYGSPEGEDWDYCGCEAIRYDYAAGADLEQMFAPTVLLGYVGGYPIYIQDKVDVAYYNSNSRYNKDLELYIPEDMDTETAIRLKSISDKSGLPRYLDFGFANAISKTYGDEYLETFLTFIADYDITDLHSGNIGFMKDGEDLKPIIFDYSSFNE